MKTSVKLLLISLLLASIGLGYYTYQKNVSLGSEVLKIDANQTLNIYSKQAMLQKVNGETIFEKGADEKIKPASLAKIMTAILAIENLPDLQQEMMTDGERINWLYSEEASVAGFLPNVPVTVEELLFGLMLPSGADAAVSLSKAVSGSDEAFTEVMNQKAKELNMTQTHFTNSYGTESAEQYSTVSDLAKLLQHALQNDTFYRVFTTPYYNGKNYSFESSLFKKLGSPDLKKGRIVGGKTGYTDEAGLCLATIAEIDGKEYLLITVGAKGNHDSKQFNMIDAKNIYNSL
ncbi:D-alanyl-D-alanine carboxypeptidase [Vagococcus coleopterorum]|uniref:D-alanyl-D-alanine carboxypeptidase n=1 Tax=Vagococcus coleopterorum TaxID=2714946 RepID=A0A6G8APM6_9ENTE|nr:serine hydrolase [Vagococcus coleopterorum]QIL46873.1 D-alanyl-D-alanine carboxypeptidase [Vagococcus coleopterorum]